MAAGGITGVVITSGWRTTTYSTRLTRDLVVFCSWRRRAGDIIGAHTGAPATTTRAANANPAFLLCGINNASGVSVFLSETTIQATKCALVAMM